MRSVCWYGAKREYFLPIPRTELRLDRVASVQLCVTHAHGPPVQLHAACLVRRSPEPFARRRRAPPLRASTGRAGTAAARGHGGSAPHSAMAELDTIELLRVASWALAVCAFLMGILWTRAALRGTAAAAVDPQCTSANQVRVSSAMPPHY